MTIHADRSAEVYIGKWINVSGAVVEMSKRQYSDGKFKSLVAFQDKAGLVLMRFNEEWIERLEVIPKHENIAVHGQIGAISGHQLDLENCELIN